MKNKTKLIALFSTASVVTAASFALILMQQSFDKAKSDSGNYTITINPEDITSSTESVDGQVTLKTDQLKNDVKFNFENVKRDGDNLVILEDGYIANAYDSQIRSIKNFNVYGNNDVFEYHFGWEAAETTINYTESDYSWANGSDNDMSSYAPNYIKIGYREYNSEVTVSKIVIEFDNKCVVGETPFVIKDGIKYRKVDGDHFVVVGYSGASFADVTIENTIDALPVTEIAERAFYYDTTIESITFGSNLTKIGSYAFSYATKLTSASSFVNMVNVGYNSFTGTNLSGDLVFSSALQRIDGGAFMSTDITSVTFADTGNPYVGDGAFRSVTTLTSVHIGSEMTDFYEDFFQCSGLETITVGAGNTKYSALDNALLDDANKTVRCIAANRAETSFTVPAGYKVKDYCAYGNQTLESITFSDATDVIPDYSFDYCAKLETINFGSYDGVRIEHAFAGCTSLKTLNISSNVGVITQRAFENCTSLETIVFEEGCTEIKREAFLDCTSLKNVLLPASLTDLGTTGGWETENVDIFQGCSALTKICTRLASGTYTGEHIIAGWDGGRALAYESVAQNNDGYHWRMVDGTPRIWGVVNVTFKVYRTDIGTGWAIYFLGSFNSWTADVDSRGSYVTDHWEKTIELTTYETYSFKGAVANWDDQSGLVYEAGDNHTFTPDESAHEYVINWQYS